MRGADVPRVEFFTILTCPVCATTVDAEVRTDPYTFEFECTNCESKVAVEIVAERVKRHAMHG
jgi:hypothetical protein